MEELLNGISDSFYSLIVDESTAVDNKKLLCLVIRYFSIKKTENDYHILSINRNVLGNI